MTGCVVTQGRNQGCHLSRHVLSCVSEGRRQAGPYKPTRDCSWVRVSWSAAAGWPPCRAAYLQERVVRKNARRHRALSKVFRAHRWLCKVRSQTIEPFWS